MMKCRALSHKEAISLLLWSAGKSEPRDGLDRSKGPKKGASISWHPKSPNAPQPISKNPRQVTGEKKIYRAEIWWRSQTIPPIKIIGSELFIWGKNHVNNRGPATCRKPTHGFPSYSSDSTILQDYSPMNACRPGTLSSHVTHLSGESRFLLTLRYHPGFPYIVHGFLRQKNMQSCRRQRCE